MATSSLCSLIAIALVLILTCTPPASARREKSRHRDEKYDYDDGLSYLCDHTHKSKICRDIIRSDKARFEDKDPKSVAVAVIDLARAKVEEIHQNLNKYRDDSNNDELKGKYKSCSKNYKKEMRNLDAAREIILSGEFRNIHDKIHDALEELKNCRHEFDKKSFDPAHIRNRNKEFRVYLDMVKVATDRLLGENERDYVGSDYDISDEE